MLLITPGTVAGLAAGGGPFSKSSDVLVRVLRRGPSLTFSVLVFIACASADRPQPCFNNTPILTYTPPPPTMAHGWTLSTSKHRSSSLIRLVAGTLDVIAADISNFSRLRRAGLEAAGRGFVVSATQFACQVIWRLPVNLKSIPCATTDSDHDSEVGSMNATAGSLKGRVPTRCSFALCRSQVQRIEVSWLYRLLILRPVVVLRGAPRTKPDTVFHPNQTHFIKSAAM
jgi:hypothetical protein